jgi:hypothetical protein
MLVVLGEVSETAVVQTPPWQPVSCHAMRVGETVKTFVAKLGTDPSGLRELL